MTSKEGTMRGVQLRSKSAISEMHGNVGGVEYKAACVEVKINGSLVLIMACTEMLR